MLKEGIYEALVESRLSLVVTHNGYLVLIPHAGVTSACDSVIRTISYLFGYGRGSSLFDTDKPN